MIKSGEGQAAHTLLPQRAMEQAFSPRLSMQASWASWTFLAWPDRTILRRSGRSVRTLHLLEAPQEPTDVRDG